MSDKSREYILEEHVMKITAALYRVTDLFHNEEPLKWVLRKNAVKILDSISKEEERDGSYLYKVKFLDEALESIREVQKKILIAQAGGFISGINFEVLGREYSHIAQSIISLRSQIESQKEGILDISSYTNNVQYKNILAKPDKKDSFVTKQNLIRSIRKDNQTEGGKISRTVTSEITERHGKIIQFLRGQGWQSISEIASIYNGEASTKTVQRDLNALVAQGVVLGEGKKRWRKYALIGKEGNSEQKNIPALLPETPIDSEIGL